jgi:hypothetical protein
MPAIVAGLLAGIVLGSVSAVLSLIRSKGEKTTAALVNFIADLIVIGIVTWCVVGFTLPTSTLAGVLPLIFTDLVIAAVIAWAADISAAGLSVSPFVMTAAALAGVFGWVAVHNGPHDAHKAAYGIVSVTCEFGQSKGTVPAPGCPNKYAGPDNVLPASSTSELVALTPDEAATKASQAMSSGLAATLNYGTYTNLGPATLERVDGTMEYVFTLEFDGAGNKARLHAVVPGYIMIDAEDPGAAPVERYASPQTPQYSMIVSLSGGQGSEPLRYARDHGYSGYLLDDPTLEIADAGTPGVAAGTPFYTVTLVTPHLGSTFMAPSGVLLIDAHTGKITRYDLPGHGKNPAPAWVDRVYSSDMAMQIANWYGKYAAGWAGVGGSNANRFQVSGDPVLTYTGDENPSWRMLLTSFNSETSVYRIVEMDSATGAIQIYRPAGPMGIETSVDQAFCNAQGLGAGNVRSNHLVPEALSLHVIDGQLVWMTSYESSQNNGGTGDATDQQAGDEGDPCGTGEAPAVNPTFTGIGFVPAYAASASNAVFGSTRAQALANLFASLASQPGSNGNAPGAAATEVIVTGKLCQKDTDVSGGTSTYYLTLCGEGGKPDYSRVYTGTSASGPAIVLAQAGDDITIKVLKVTASSSQQQVQSFADKQHPLAAAGS